ncbi:MAG TPA: cobalamin-binding protein [Actinomycetota bacterium]|nr:cobalamin-binding protein [Actinomycetota bacterium]
MRIVSLLPSATEIVYALDLGDQLVGVTHECDWPPEARGKPLVSHTTLPAGAAPAEIDRLVSESLDGGDPTYRLDHEAIRELRPDVVITQDLCAVCAVPSGHVQAALDLLGSPAQVVSLDPSSLGEVLDCVLRVGRVSGHDRQAQAYVRELQARLDRVRAAVAGLDRPRVFALEWGDPPFNGGHWVPEMIELAGGECVLGAPGTPSVRLTWEAVAAAAPDAVVFMPCGYQLDAAVAEGAALMDHPGLAGAARFYAADSSAYFSRPGPRLVDGVELLAAALHPGSVIPQASGGIARLR